MSDYPCYGNLTSRNTECSVVMTVWREEVDLERNTCIRHRDAFKDFKFLGQFKFLDSDFIEK